MKKHKTDKDGFTAFERVDNEYCWQIVPHVSTVVDESPRPMSSSLSRGDGFLSLTPITVYNNWPKQLSNASIFPWLLPHAPHTRYSEFYQFVKTWYQSACAIVYYPSIGDPKIIGSGSLTNTTVVSTARHNFDGVPCSKLFVRFFKFSVEVHPSSRNFLLIREQHLDIPVIKKSIATNGIDAGYLVIPSLKVATVFSQYEKVLPVNKTLFDSSLPDGHYAMFHFSSGKPQVSIGKIETYYNIGSRLHDEITIQAGPGASGAAIIWKGFDKVLGGGISIYRVIRDGLVDRRIINFSQFESPGYIDRISAPYYYDPKFVVVPTDALNESGYEFLRYRLETHAGRRVDSPNDDVYRVDPHHSNHHIIPIGDLLYLWDYFHRLDENSVLEINRQVNVEVQDFKKRQRAALNREIDDFYPLEKSQRWSAGIIQIRRDAEVFRERRFRVLYAAELTRKYSRFYAVLTLLCPNQTFDRTWFAWSFWNLFKGWEKDYRTDDPADGCSLDFSEKIRPRHFRPTLWNCIKDTESGLYRRIQQLKRTSAPNTTNEATLFSCLDTLQKEWSSRTRAALVIHPYNSDEWNLMGKKAGHEIYRVKPS